MFRVSGRFSRLMAAGACAAMISASALAVPPKPSGPKSVPITIPLSVMPGPASAWSAADERYEARRHWKRHRHNDGIDGGDLLVGLLVLGGVAAVASSIDKSGDEPRERERRDYPQPSYDYRGDASSDDDWRSGQPSSSRAMDRAVEACTAEAAREGQVDEIYEVDRIDGEWRVRGDFRDGGAFTCAVDEDGRARVGIGDQAALGGWDAPGGDDFTDGQGPRAQIGADDDDRYATGEIPDFEGPRVR